MSISCECDSDGCDWWYAVHTAKPLATKRWRKCTSCHTKIAVGETCRTIARWRNPETDYEERRFCDEVPLTPWHFCEECGLIFDALRKQNICIDFLSSLKEDLAEFNRDYAPSGFELKVHGVQQESENEYD